YQEWQSLCYEIKLTSMRSFGCSTYDNSKNNTFSFIHPLSIGYRIHDVLRSSMMKRNKYIKI
ncbi:MAG: hypothetical protein J7K34_07815, partial [Flavobacteriaceae bacterium]|nr:hypothetical protein [Flavobacteriaceae bacterium]